jgi:hypothetical protein
MTKARSLRTTVCAASLAVAASAAAAVAQTADKAQTVNGLQIAVSGLERAEKAALKDCPPGTNTVNAVQRPGDEIAVVTVSFKVLPEFKATMMKRPTVTSADGKVYNTSVQLVDVGSVPQYSCQFIYRVPQGTKLKSLQVDTATFDLAPLEK